MHAFDGAAREGATAKALVLRPFSYTSCFADDSALGVQHMEDAERSPLEVSMRYVAFCDVLGFANAVQERFDETIELYNDFTRMMGNWEHAENVQVVIYSDSILITSDELMPLLSAVQMLSFATLAHDLLIRGGVAYGRYWERKESGNLFVVSDALVRAVKLESTVKIPAVAFSPEVEVPLKAWLPHFAGEVFSSPVLHFRNISVVNPFNQFWFQSSRTRVGQMKERFPAHAAKYNWFLDLGQAVDNGELLVPQAVTDRLVADGVIVWTPYPDEAAPKDVS